MKCHIARASMVLGTIVLLGGCVETRGSAWMKQPLVAGDGDEAWEKAVRETSTGTNGKNESGKRLRSRTIGAKPRNTRQQRGQPGTAPRRTVRVTDGRLVGKFRNTYYSFPWEGDYGGPPTAIYNAQCQKIALVPQEFHDTLCVQGSGRLSTGQTVSFAKRDCACARVCPRTGQKICYEALPKAKFPWGRGAAGKPIHPFRTIAADTTVLPMGTVVFVPAYAGKPIPGGGGVHDGCFRVEDRGRAIKGNSIDVFVGKHSSLRAWNSLVPSGSFLEVYVEHRACDYLAK